MVDIIPFPHTRGPALQNGGGDGTFDGMEARVKLRYYGANSPYSMMLVIDGDECYLVW